jgi:hypothetical protein
MILNYLVTDGNIKKTTDNHKMATFIDMLKVSFCMHQAFISQQKISLLS